MPIIYTYPSATPASGDLLLISDVSETEPENATRTCTVGDIVTLVGALVPGGGTVTSVGLDFQTTGLTTGGVTSETITTTGSFDIAGTLVAANGGTGHNSYTVGDLIYASGATALSKLTAGTLGNVLMSSGPGVAPTWSAPTLGTVTSVDVSSGTTGMVFSGGPITSSGTITMSGTLQVDNGGTERSTLTQNAFLVGDNQDPVQLVGPLTNGQLLIGNTGSTPHLGTLLGGTNITIDASTLPTGLTINASALGTMSSFTLAGSAGVNQTISNGDTLTIAAGSGITTTGSATDTVTIAAVTLSKTDPYTGLGLKGSGSGSFTPSTNLAAYWTSGDYVYVEFYMAWLVAEGAAIVGNLILTGLPVAAYQSGLIDNGNCIIHVNSSLGSSASLQAPTTGWVGISGVTTEMTFRRHDTAGVFTDYAYTNKVGDASSYALGGTIRYLQTVA